MLPNNLRLNLRKNQQIFENSTRFRTKYFSGYFQREDAYQFAVIVTKKFYQKAESRNEIKRKVREVVGAVAKLNHLPTGKFVLIVGPNLKTKTLSELAEDLMTARL